VLIVISFGTIIHQVEVKIVMVPIAVVDSCISVQLTISYPVVLSCSAMVHSVFETDTSWCDAADTLALINRLVSYTADVASSDASR